MTLQSVRAPSTNQTTIARNTHR